MLYYNMQKIKRFYDHLEIETKSVVENVKDIVESLEDSVEVIAFYVDSEAFDSEGWDIARRDPDVQENLRLGGSYRFEVSLTLSKQN